MRITSIRLLTLSALFTTILFSCAREESLELPTVPGTQGGNKLQGIWDFAGIYAETYTANSATMGGETQRTVTTSNYTTKKNGGTITIDAVKCTASNITYLVDTLAHSLIYTNGVLTDQLDWNFQFSVSPMSSTAPYRLIGTDSIYLEKGLVSYPDNNGNPLPSAPSGARISWSGDTLLLRTSLNYSSTQATAGVVVSVVQRGFTVMKLKKRG